MLEILELFTPNHTGRVPSIGITLQSFSLVLKDSIPQGNRGTGYLGVAEPGEPIRKLPALEAGQHCLPASSKFGSSLGMLLAAPPCWAGFIIWGHCTALGTLH